MVQFQVFDRSALSAAAWEEIRTAVVLRLPTFQAFCINDDHFKQRMNKKDRRIYMNASTPAEAHMFAMVAPEEKVWTVTSVCAEPAALSGLLQAVADDALQAGANTLRVEALRKYRDTFSKHGFVLRQRHFERALKAQPVAEATNTATTTPAPVAQAQFSALQVNNEEINLKAAGLLSQEELARYKRLEDFIDTVRLPLFAEWCSSTHTVYARWRKANCPAPSGAEMREKALQQIITSRRSGFGKWFGATVHTEMEMEMTRASHTAETIPSGPSQVDGNNDLAIFTVLCAILFLDTQSDRLSRQLVAYLVHFHEASRIARNVIAEVRGVLNALATVRKGRATRVAPSINPNGPSPTLVSRAVRALNLPFIPAVELIEAILGVGNAPADAMLSTDPLTEQEMVINQLMIATLAIISMGKEFGKALLWLWHDYSGNDVVLSAVATVIRERIPRPGEHFYVSRADVHRHYVDVRPQLAALAEAFVTSFPSSSFTASSPVTGRTGVQNTDIAAMATVVEKPRPSRTRLAHISSEPAQATVATFHSAKRSLPDFSDVDKEVEQGQDYADIAEMEASTVGSWKRARRTQPIVVNKGSVPSLKTAIRTAPRAPSISRFDNAASMSHGVEEPTIESYYMPPPPPPPATTRERVSMTHSRAPSLRTGTRVLDSYVAEMTTTADEAAASLAKEHESVATTGATDIGTPSLSDYLGEPANSVHPSLSDYLGEPANSVHPSLSDYLGEPANSVRLSSSPDYSDLESFLATVGKSAAAGKPLSFRVRSGATEASTRLKNRENIDKFLASWIHDKSTIHYSNVMQQVPPPAEIEVSPVSSIFTGTETAEEALNKIVQLYGPLKDEVLGCGGWGCTFETQDEKLVIKFSERYDNRVYAKRIDTLRGIQDSRLVRYVAAYDLYTTHEVDFIPESGEVTLSGGREGAERKSFNYVTVMERAPGQTLTDVVDAYTDADVAASPELFEAVFVAVAADLLAALQTLHSACITHGDVKPDNILLDINWEKELPTVHTTLIDADEACRMCDSEGCVDKCDELACKEITGTPVCMSPEYFDAVVAQPMLSKEQEQSIARIDLRKQDTWAVGITLYFLAERGYPYNPNMDDAGFDAKRAAQELAGIASNLRFTRATPRMQTFIKVLLEVDPALRPTPEAALALM